MESYELLGFVGILRECKRNLSKNGKLMATLTTISIFLSSFILFTYIFSTKPVIGDLITKGTLLSHPSPNAPNFVNLFNDIKDDVQTIVGVQFIFLLASFASSLFVMLAIVLASAVACCNKTISFRDLLSRLPKSCLRPLVTLFHLKLFSLGFIFILLAILVSLMIMSFDRPLTMLSIIITLGVLASILVIYLSVVWELALVISVIEQSCYGIEAIGKAGALIKGKRLDGFALNFLFTLVMVIISQGVRVTQDQKSVPIQIIFGLLLTCFSCLVTMVYLMSYTVLYFQCKKTHGEEVELQGSLEYSKIPSIP